MSEYIHWRNRSSTVLADLYDGDRHLWVGPDRNGPRVGRSGILIPHPLPGITYGDGRAPDTVRSRQVARGDDPWAARHRREDQ